MAMYPIQVPVGKYEGNDSGKRAKYQRQLEQAAQIEEYINSRMVIEYEATFSYYAISVDLGISKEAVRELLSPIDGTPNEITVKVNAKNWIST
jgi:hypothetical protein